MEVEKTTVNILNHSRILDELVTHRDSRVRVAAADFIEAFQPPADAPHIKLVLKRLLAGLMRQNEELKLDQAFGYPISSVSILINAANSFANDRQRADEMPTSRWLKKFPAYGAILEIVEDDTSSIMAIAAAFALSQLTRKSIDKKFADQLRVQSRSSASENRKAANSKDRSWEARHQVNLKNLKVLSGCIVLPSGAEFQEAAISYYLADSKFARRAERRGLSDDRALTENAFKDVVRELRRELLEFNAITTAICVGFLSGLSWPLAKRIPLSEPVGNDWVIWLDVPNRCFHVNLNPLVRGAAANRGDEKYVPATRIFCRYLPALVGKSLQFLLLKRPNSGSLEALCDCPEVASEFDIHHTDDRRVKNSIARFFNTRTVISNMLYISGVAVALSLGCFQRIPHSRLFYNTTDLQQLEAATSKLATLLDWGDTPTQGEVGPAIGSSATPEVEALKNIAIQLATAVRDTQPPRNFRWRHLRKFHNAFTDYVIFVLSLSAMGRDTQELLIQAIGSIASMGMTGLHDKVTANSLGASPVVLAKIARQQVKAYLLHLKCLLARMKTLGLADTPGQTRVSQIQEDAEVDAFFHLPEEPEGELLTRGTATLYRDLSGWLEIKPDGGRHFWESMLSKHDVPEHYSDAQARHTVRHARYWSSSSTLAIDQMQETLSPVQDQILRQLEVQLVWGLRK